MAATRRSRREVRALFILALCCGACGSDDGGNGTTVPDATPGGGSGSGGSGNGGTAGGSVGGEPSGGGVNANGDAGPETDAGPGPGPGEDGGPAPVLDASGPVADLGPVGPDPRLDTLIADAAAAVCGALFRCCDDGSVTTYFEPYLLNEALEDFHPRLPPGAPLTAEACPTLVAEMLTVVPLGRWVAAAEAGYVQLVPAAVDACLDALGTAACGDDVTSALLDSSCFWLNPPVGGSEQRTIFARTATEGACRSLNDGFGGVFFGTCDPELAFCCLPGPEGCGFPDGSGSEGVCQPAAAEGQACSQIPVQLCRTGLECGDDGICRQPVTTALAVGEPCVDDRFNLLGECIDSFCDLFGTSVCVARRAVGERCMGADECLSLACLDGICGDLRFCEGR